MSVNPLEQAIALIKQGKHAKAQKLLKTLIAADHQNLPAWFWFVETCATNKQRIAVLEICLEYNPENEQVKQTLESLRSMPAKSQPVQSDNKQFVKEPAPFIRERSNYFFITFIGALLVNALILAIKTTATYEGNIFTVVGQGLVIFLVILSFSQIFPTGLSVALLGIVEMIFPNSTEDIRHPLFFLLLITTGPGVMYLLLLRIGSHTKKHKFFLYAYIIFVILLIINIAGCVRADPINSISNWVE